MATNSSLLVQQKRGQDFSEGALIRTLRGNKDLSFMSGKHGSLDTGPGFPGEEQS